MKRTCVDRPLIGAQIELGRGDPEEWPLVKKDLSLLGLGLYSPTKAAALMPLICTLWLLVVSCPSWAGNQEKRFLEFPGRRKHDNL